MSHHPGEYGQEEDGNDNRRHWKENVLWSSQLHCHRQCPDDREASDNRDQREILESTASKDFGYLIVRDVVAATGQLRNSQPISLQALGTSNNEAATDGRSRARKSPAPDAVLNALRTRGVQITDPDGRPPKAWLST